MYVRVFKKSTSWLNDSLGAQGSELSCQNQKHVLQMFRLTESVGAWLETGRGERKLSLFETFLTTTRRASRDVGKFFYLNRS
jgi:hypothetical protein